MLVNQIVKYQLFILLLVFVHVKGWTQVPVVSLKVNNSTDHEIVKAFRIATGDLYGNMQTFKGGLLRQESPCLLAGLDYDKPWTRDAAINVWNAGCLLFPEVSKNTLLAQCGKTDGKLVIQGQYWDKIIWTIGAWNYYLGTGDKEFLELAYKATANTLQILEEEEWSDSLHLFRGAAVYGDGVSAYPKVYTESEIDSHPTGSFSGIFEWAEYNPDRKVKKGVGLPMHVLSTNAVYYKVYKLMPLIEKALGEKQNATWSEKANRLKQAINDYFWDTNRKLYNYLVDPFGNCKAQEGLGISFALLFNIATPEMAEQIMNHAYVLPTGIPCLYPSFERYRNTTINSYGRHSGTIWPQVQGFWADAMIQYHNYDAFLNEFTALTDHVNHDKQFVEIYHPDTGLPYGGIQEPTNNNWSEWFCADRQSWSATAYLRMILKGLVGIRLTSSGMLIQPYLPQSINELEIHNIPYRKARLNIRISGNGDKIKSFLVNGKESKNLIPEDMNGEINIEIINET